MKHAEDTPALDLALILARLVVLSIAAAALLVSLIVVGLSLFP